ncbi:MAG: cytidine deaminase [Deltaproteobacteria bacterium]|nr:cytidine deaminase [Deltaproteobacteria bacterium]
MKKLIQAAKVAREHACAHVTGYKVGAALETAKGKVYTGANVESPSAISCLCAERVALFSALSQGERLFKRIVTVAERKHPIPPCGFCRQTLLEFAPELEVIMANLEGKTKRSQLAELMPDAYLFE